MCSHLLSSKNLSIEFIEDLFRTANDMKDLVQFKGGDKSLSVKVMTSAFFEASTRTNCSFQAAMLRLGGKVIATNETFSSVIKGESLGDTIRTLACYSDVIVLRHPQVGASEIAASVSTKPIINAGNVNQSFTFHIASSSMLDHHFIHRYVHRRRDWRTPHSESVGSVHYPDRTTHHSGVTQHRLGL
jgi:aspartate carbamoyltransferase catalytic subunit